MVNQEAAEKNDESLFPIFPLNIIILSQKKLKWTLILSLYKHSEM